MKDKAYVVVSGNYRNPLVLMEYGQGSNSYPFIFYDYNAPQFQVGFDFIQVRHK